MKILHYKIITLLLLTTPFLSTANNDKGKYTKEKTIIKNFTVNANALLKVNNKYGNLNITSWDENRIEIEVHIKTSGNNEEKVQRKLDNITVNFEGSSSIVSAKTNIAKSSSWGWGNSNNVNMQINYTIKLPVKNNIDLTNDYGSITLDRIDGHATINCDYGRLDIGELRGRNNNLNFDYTSKSEIGYVNSAKIDADYSGFSITKAGNLDLNTDYTSAAISKMDNLVYNSDYGSLSVNEAQNIKGNGDYISVKLGKINGNITLDADYGSIKIDELTGSAGNVTINADYTGVKVGYHASYNFNFNLKSAYGGINGVDNCNISLKEVKNSQKNYKGSCGSENSNNFVNINTEYGSISIHKN
ncbi:DUF4097 family beta strand repeat-containing protein [Cellulophaga omnivescoria]|uniref:hypothetical protein n=1 Tax=Cellulophaga omnivescoria TaxID=1888890 RepID=UPI0022F015E6|nr:hypothetical protein [Cellulophaga omnivescoria]WBU91002.1 hypothetical protein PBN93_00900 [Cellulophaga omnivescoria]WKB83093.1 hypothetical protein QYR09_00905 [Cellulophaga lytica]